MNEEILVERVITGFMRMPDIVFKPISQQGRVFEVVAGGFTLDWRHADMELTNEQIRGYEAEYYRLRQLKGSDNG